MLIDHMKETAKGSFKGAIIAAIGAAIVYLAIKGWRKIKG